MSSLADRYQRVLASLPGQVKLIAVSKTRSAEEVQALYDLGHRAFGENYPQELKEKAAALPKDIAWHLIGHLQRSNVKHVIGIAQLIHGVDSERLLEEIEKRSAQADIRTDVLLQVHIAQEDTKHGFAPAEVMELVQRPALPASFPHIRFRGLMGMATNTDDHSQVSREFASLADLFKRIRAVGCFPADQFTELSMGMSGDAPLAVDQGSTMVRIGTAIFGERTL
jgi:pyridoxal phosphate enzyme (YggS family)